MEDESNKKVVRFDPNIEIQTFDVSNNHKTNSSQQDNSDSSHQDIAKKKSLLTIDFCIHCYQCSAGSKNDNIFSINS